MSSTQILLIVVGVAVGVMACLLVFFPLLKKRGVNTGDILGATLTGVKGANELTDALKAIFPQSAVINIVDKIIDYAQIGVEKAEQLYKINEITGDERKLEAENFVYQSLELAGIEVTDQVRAIVDGCIEAAVLGLGHSVADVVLESSNGE